jgi:hypothetical protein
MRFAKPMTQQATTQAKVTRSPASALVLSAALGVTLAGLPAACDKPAAPPPPAAPAQASPPAPVPTSGGDAGAAKPKMVANPDGLSLADRIAKRQANEAKVAAELAIAEKERLLQYDRTKLPLHQQTFAFIQKTRAQYDAVEKKGPKAKAELDKLRDGLQKPIAAAAKKMATIDPKGGNSNVTTDYDVMLNALANDYPAAIAASFDGDKAALVEQTAELDRRSQKVGDWLAELQPSKGHSKSQSRGATKKKKKK